MIKTLFRAIFREYWIKATLAFGIFFIFSFLFFPQKIYAATNADSININLNVAFCNFDLTCDPEENYISCLNDCPAPPVSTTTPPATSTPATTTSNINRSSGRSGLNAFFFNSVINDSTKSVTNVSFEIFLGKPFMSWQVVSEQTGILHNFVFPPTVRILRSENNYAQFPDRDGIILYEDTGTMFYDTSALEQKTYFYTLFVKDQQTGIFKVPIQVGQTNGFISVVQNLNGPSKVYSGTNMTSWFLNDNVENSFGDLYERVPLPGQHVGMNHLPTFWEIIRSFFFSFGHLLLLFLIFLIIFVLLFRMFRS